MNIEEAKNKFNKNRKKSIIIGSIVLVLIIIVYSFFSNNDEVLYDVHEVSYGSISQEVTETGIVRPGQTADMAFKIQGTVEEIKVKVGDKVTAGQELIMLEQDELRLKVSKASAAWVVAKATLDKLITGVTEEDKQVYLTAVTNAEKTLLNKQIALEDTKSDAESDLKQAYEDMINEMHDAYIKADDAVRNQVDQFIDNPRSSNPDIAFNVSDSQLESNIENSRFLIEAIFVYWQGTLTGLTATGDLDPYVGTMESDLLEIKSFLDSVSLAVNNLSPYGSLTQTTIDGWKTDVLTARTNVSTELASITNQKQTIETTKITNQTNINTAQAAVDTAEASLKTAQDKLAQTIAPPRSEDLSLTQAQVDQAAATLAISREDLKQSVIISPFDGIVTDIDVEVGETVSIGGVVVSVDSKDSFQIEVDIYEEDIPWVDVGDPVNIELVAFPNEMFNGIVMSVEPAEKMIDGVVYYEVKIGINYEKAGVKNGMTADVTIITDSKDRVLLVPRKAVNKRDGISMVEILVNDVIEEREIKVGLQGSNDMFEVVSGLEQGDQIIVR
jgi:multidrug efflux pump subunit AcrA (membrane-fusion protein)